MKLCLFCTYSDKDYFDNYVLYYISQLCEHNDKVVVVTNNRPLKNLVDVDKRAVVNVVENEGYDFGMWYKMLIKYQEILPSVTMLSLVNDSCILFKPLTEFYNWANQTIGDVVGITDSNMMAYHIQSYFMVFKGQRAIQNVLTHFAKHGIVRGGVHGVIRIYEIGLSQHLIANRHLLQSYFPIPKRDNTNQSVFKAAQTISMGNPLIKKKVYCGSFRPDEVGLLKMSRYNFSANYIDIMKKANPDMDWRWLLMDDTI